jgi:hypothetical protein
MEALENPPKPTPKNELRLLDPKRTRLTTNAFGRLELEVGFEERYGPVKAMRALPLTQPDRYISIQLEEGDEIGMIADMSELDADSRRAVEADLNLYYLKALVRNILKVESKNGIITWDLETNLGSKRVHVRDRQNIRSLPDGRVMLTDIHGAKYEIPPVEELDARSRHFLEVEL